MDVSVTNLGDDGYEVKIGEKTVMLPKGSSFKEGNPRAKTGQNAKIGTGTIYLEIEPYRYSMLYINNGNKEVILSDDDDDEDDIENAIDERGQVYLDLKEAWDVANKPPKGSSRLNRKAKRTKRNSRNLKRSKLRKLTTRRR
jgi:hypothetical protein